MTHGIRHKCAILWLAALAAFGTASPATKTDSKINRNTWDTKGKQATITVKASQRYVPGYYGLPTGHWAPADDMMNLDDVSNDWALILNDRPKDEKPACPDLGVIFVPGTFDSGNIGVWVGPYLKFGLKQSVTKNGKSFMFQGVGDPYYSRNLTDYLFLGGSDTAATYVADSMEEFAKACPQTKQVMSCWSQGCLSAHKAFGRFKDKATLQNIMALVAFGDPIKAWQTNPTKKRANIAFPALPTHVRYISSCMNEATDGKGMRDPLCDGTPSTFTGLGATAKAILQGLGSAFKGITHVEDEQVMAAGTVAKGLARSMVNPAVLKKGVDDAKEGTGNHWFLSVPHFYYGVNGQAETAAAEVFDLFKKE